MPENRTRARRALDPSGGPDALAPAPLAPEAAREGTVLAASGPHADTLVAALRVGDRVPEPEEAEPAEESPTDRATHGFHAYPASLDPRAAKLLIPLGEGPVLDPFCGGGTVLVEALLQGRSALGLDVSPVAGLVARARTTLTDEAARTALRSAARKAADAALSVGPEADREVPTEVMGWYEPHVARELVALRRAIGKDSLLEAVFSSILVKVSLRESETRAHRVVFGEPGARPPRPPGTTATLFHRKARESARRLEALAAAVPEGVRARVHREDARDFRSKERFGLVLTSPPYPGVYDYLALQALRAAWLGLPADLHAEIGSRRGFRADRSGALSAWEVATRKWLRRVARALAPSGRVLVIIGDGFGAGKLVPVLPGLLGAARELGLERVGLATVSRFDAGLQRERPEHAVLLELRGPPPDPEG